MNFQYLSKSFNKSLNYSILQQFQAQQADLVVHGSQVI